MKHSDLKPAACPTCGYEMDSASCMTDERARPKPGDLSLCLKCGEILTFNAELVPVLPSVNDLLNLPHNVNAQLMLAQGLIRQHRFIP